MRTPDFIVPEKLHTLSLAQNAIQDLSEVHPNFLRTVRYLDMSDNKIREVRYHGHFDKSAPLQNLDLSHNNISVVEDCAFCNTSLHTLNLAFNGMNSANPDMINYVSIHTRKNNKKVGLEPVTSILLAQCSVHYTTEISNTFRGQTSYINPRR